MNKLVFSLAFAWSLLQVSAAEVEWLTDISKALKQASNEHKQVLLDFTGSDW